MKSVMSFPLGHLQFAQWVFVTGFHTGHTWSTCGYFMPFPYGKPPHCVSYKFENTFDHTLVIVTCSEQYWHIQLKKTNYDRHPVRSTTIFLLSNSFLSQKLQISTWHKNSKILQVSPVGTSWTQSYQANLHTLGTLQGNKLSFQNRSSKPLPKLNTLPQNQLKLA